MFGFAKKDNTVTSEEQPLMEEVPDQFVIPMPQELQPDPFYGFEPPRDESQFTGQGYVHPENETVVVADEKDE